MQKVLGDSVTTHNAGSLVNSSLRRETEIAGTEAEGHTQASQHPEICQCTGKGEFPSGALPQKSPHKGLKLRQTENYRKLEGIKMVYQVRYQEGIKCGITNRTLRAIAVPKTKAIVLPLPISQIPCLGTHVFSQCQLQGTWPLNKQVITDVKEIYILPHLAGVALASIGLSSVLNSDIVDPSQTGD